MLLCDVHDHLHFLVGQEHAGGVAWVGAHDGTGMGGYESLYLGAIGITVAFLGRGGDGNDLTAGGVGHGVVVGIEWLGDEDLVIVVQNRLQGEAEGLAAAGSDEDLALVKVHVELIIVLLDSLDQDRHTGRRSIGQNGLLKMLDSIEKLLRCLDIGLADVKMIDFLALGFRCHRIGVELAHGGQTAFFNFAGKLHLSGSS